MQISIPPPLPEFVQSFSNQEQSEVKHQKKKKQKPQHSVIEETYAWNLESTLIVVNMWIKLGM